MSATSNVLTVKIEADNSAAGGGLSGKPGDGIGATPWEQWATSGLIEQRRRAFETMRKTEEQAEAKRLKDIQEGQKFLEDARNKRIKEEAKAEDRRLRMIEEGQKFLEDARNKRIKEEAKAEDRRLRMIEEGQKFLEDLRKKRQKAEEDAEKERLRVIGNRAASVKQQRADWERKQGEQAGGLRGLLNKFVPGGGDILSKLTGMGGNGKMPQFVGKDIQPAAGTQLAKPVGIAGEAAEGGALAGLGGAAMAAAGPLAAAFAIAAVAAKVMTTSLNAMREKVEQTGKSFRRLADDDVAGKFEDTVDSVAKDAAASDITGISGPVREAVIRLAAAPILEFKKTLDTYLARGRDLSQYSGPAAQATAMADVAKILADLKEGQELGEGYAKLIEQQSRIETTVRDFLLPFKGIVVDMLGGALELIADNTKQALEVAEQVAYATPFIGSGIQALVLLKKEEMRIKKLKDASDIYNGRFASVEDLFAAMDRGVPDPGIALPAPAGPVFAAAARAPIGLGARP